MATARPMPESPPVMIAARPSSLPEPVYDSSPWSGLGVISAVWPGGSCCCSGWGGVGPACLGSWGMAGHLLLARVVAAATERGRGRAVPTGRALTRFDGHAAADQGDARAPQPAHHHRL